MHLPRTLTVLATALAVSLPLACSSDTTASNSATTTTQAAGAPTTTTAGGSGGAAPANLPDDWPAALALPADVTVLSFNKTGATSMTVVARIDGDSEAVWTALKTQLADAGYEIVGSTFTPSDKGGAGSISAKNPDRTVAIAFGPDPTGKTSQVTFNVAAVSP